MAQLKDRAKMGRPKAFKTVKELDGLIVKFWEYVKVNKVPATIARLAVFLKVDRETIVNYSKDQEFFGTIKEVKEMILASKEERLNSETGQKVGIIFDLKNNHGFKDKQEVDMNVKGNISLGDMMKEQDE